MDVHVSTLMSEVAQEARGSKTGSLVQCGWGGFDGPIASMGRNVYLPTWMVDFYGFHVGNYGIRGWYGSCFFCRSCVNPFLLVNWFRGQVKPGTGKSLWEGLRRRTPQAQLMKPSCLLYTNRGCCSSSSSSSSCSCSCFCSCSCCCSCSCSWTDHGGWVAPLHLCKVV